MRRQAPPVRARDVGPDTSGAPGVPGGARSGALAALAVLAFAALATGTAAWLAGVTSGPLVTAVALAPYLGLGYLALVLLTLVNGQRLLAGLCGALLLVHAGDVATFCLPDQGHGAEARGQRLVVMTVNAAGSTDPAPILQLVQEHRVDLLAVQELDTELASALRAEGLDRLLPYEHVQAAPFAAAGSGIWSRYPLSERGRIAGMALANLHATADVEGRAVRVVAVHPQPPGLTGDPAWAREHRALREHLARSRGPLVVLGDFNATDQHQVMAELRDLGLGDAAELAGAGLLRTWPAEGSLPQLFPIDHVLVSRELAVASAVASNLPPGTSNHAAVISILALRPPAAR